MIDDDRYLRKRLGKSGEVRELVLVQPAVIGQTKLAERGKSRAKFHIFQQIPGIRHRRAADLGIPMPCDDIANSAQPAV